MGDPVTVVIPADLVDTVAFAMEHLAEWYRQDTGHDPAGIAALQADADRLDVLAESIRQAGRVPLAPAFDRAAVAITGQPAADLNERLTIESRTYPGPEGRFDVTDQVEQTGSGTRKDEP
jgi:hypothetical protein